MISLHFSARFPLCFWIFFSTEEEGHVETREGGAGAQDGGVGRH